MTGPRLLCSSLPLVLGSLVALLISLLSITPTQACESAGQMIDTGYHNLIWNYF